MIKKLQLLLLLLFVISVPLAAQYTHVELSYQSFRPFIHFQLNFESNGYDYHQSYDNAYLKGYMDGVNHTRYYHLRFYDLVSNINAYKAGYRDGFQDRKLVIRLRGYAWYRSHRFGYDDYYAPSYAVRIWLDGLSLAFLQAPVHRLPKRWKYRAHPHVIHYRKWMGKKKYHKGYSNYYSSTNVERRFKKRIRGYRKQAQKVRIKNRRTVSGNRGHQTKQRYRPNRAFKKHKGNHIKRSKIQKRATRKAVRKETQKRRETIKKSRDKKRERSKIKRNRGSKNSKSKRSRGNSRKRKNNG